MIETGNSDADFQKLVVVEWQDSARPESAWRYLDDTPDLEVVTCLSVGWVVAESEKVLMLAPNLGHYESGGGEQGCGFIRIPTCAIQRLMELDDPT